MVHSISTAVGGVLLGRVLSSVLALFVTFFDAGDGYVGGRDIFAEAGDAIGAGGVGTGDDGRPTFDIGGDFGVTDGLARGILDEAKVIGPVVMVVIVRAGFAAGERRAGKSQKQIGEKSGGKVGAGGR